MPKSHSQCTFPPHNHQHAGEEESVFPNALVSSEAKVKEGNFGERLKCTDANSYFRHQMKEVEKVYESTQATTTAQRQSVSSEAKGERRKLWRKIKMHPAPTHIFSKFLIRHQMKEVEKVYESIQAGHHLVRFPNCHECQ